MIKFVLMSALAIAAATVLMATVTVYAISWSQDPFVPQDNTAPVLTGYSFAVLPYDLQGLSTTADLIIEGKVLDKDQGKKVGHADPGVPPELVTFPSVNNEIQVQKVLKGDYPVNKTINVITIGDLSGKVFVEDSVELKKGEKAVFFLMREPVYDNAWTLVGYEQGKFKVDGSGGVHGNPGLGPKVDASNSDELKQKIDQTLKQPKPKVKVQHPDDKDLRAPSVP